MAIRATLLALLFACKPATTEPPPAATEPPPAAQTAPACVDQQLAKRNLDQFGGEQGTMYPGGTPLFQESTGKRTDRTRYVYAHHPDIAALCGADAGP
ncbi:MAG TPA: hypothetical protein VH083_04225 [Myxococcales bacterium]|jgi:hypothetical protein|nr:hypothetical protein [Myxococcales bacterium]